MLSPKCFVSVSLLRPADSCGQRLDIDRCRVLYPTGSQRRRQRNTARRYPDRRGTVRERGSSPPGQAAMVSGSGSCSMTASWSSSDVCFCTCADISGSCRSCCRANRTPPMAHDMHSTARPRSHTGAECTRVVCAGVAGTAASDVRVVTICSACASESASERTSRRSFCCMRATRRFMTGSRVTASCFTRSTTA